MMITDSASLLEKLAEALSEVKGKPEEDLRTVLEGLYSVDPRLPSAIDDFETYIGSADPQRTVLGQKLEQIAYLAFSGLNGFPDVSAYRSATSQHDLLLSGDGLAAMTLCKLIRVSDAQRGILVECKAEREEKVGDPQFRRLCSLLSDHFPATVGLGVFFTLKGASGFPQVGREIRKIGDAHLTQVIYYARSGKPIIVFDWQDIRSLTRPGSLPLLMKRRIEAIEKLSSASSMDREPCQQVTLPAHLQQLRDRS